MWSQVKDGNPVCFELFRRHYSFNRKRDQMSFWREGSDSLFVGPGEKMVLLSEDERAMFVWRKYISDDGQAGVNCAVFRNEMPRPRAVESSDLIRMADDLAWERWPGERLYTYVDPRRTRRKRDPGRCFLRAGWRPGTPEWTKGGLRILECPPIGTRAICG